VTNYRLRFEPAALGDETTLNGGRIIDVTLGSISKVEKLGHSTNDRWPSVGINKVEADKKYGLIVNCKVGNCGNQFTQPKSLLIFRILETSSSSMTTERAMDGGIYTSILGDSPFQTPTSL